jgi:outer membrane protein assembly factor BamA
LRGFTFRGVPPKAGSPGGGREEPDALGRESKDARVEVREQRTGSLLFGIGVNSDAGLTGSIVLNERNFDILLPPASYDERISGSALRGAGQELRMEAVPGPFEGFKFGGDFLFLNSIEYQVPVRANDGIFEDAFIDGGMVGQKVEIKDYRVSAGFGVRLAILMLGSAPTGQDSASPSVKRSEAPERLFSFWMGYFS